MYYIIQIATALGRHYSRQSCHFTACA